MRKYPPKKGAFIVYKKGKLHNSYVSKDVLIKLAVSGRAKRFQSSASVVKSHRVGAPKNYLKMRVSHARVLEITVISTGEKVRAARNYHVGRWYQLYEVGKVVRPDFFSTLDKPCAPGIHCFMSKQMALDYT